MASQLRHLRCSPFFPVFLSSSSFEVKELANDEEDEEEEEEEEEGLKEGGIQVGDIFSTTLPKMVFTIIGSLKTGSSF